jgi:MFS family permease
VISYSAAITSSLGFGPVAQLCITSGYLTTGLAAVIIGSLIVDRVGRVKLILLGTALQIILLCCITSIIARFAGGRNKPANVAAIVLIFIYFVCYGVCVEGQIYIYGSELFPSHLRAKGVTFGVSFVYLVNIPFTT